MKRYAINIVIRCKQCSLVKPLCFSGLGESHADYFKQALASKLLPDWHCDQCGRKHNHDVISCDATEEGAAAR